MGDQMNPEPSSLPVDETVGTTSGADGPQEQRPEMPPPPTDEELRQTIKSAMQACLKAQARLLELQAREQQANAAREQASSAFTSMQLPTTADENEVVGFFAERQRRFFTYVDTLEPAVQAAGASVAAEEAHNTARQALEDRLNEAATINESLRSDPVYCAGLHLLWQLRPVDQRIAPTVRLSPDVVLPDDQQELIVKLQKATLAQGVVTAAALVLAPQLNAVISRVRQTSRPAVKPPVRPIEEEIQRYLHQSETAMVNRRLARLECHQIMRRRGDLLSRLESAARELNNSLAAVQALPASLCILQALALSDAELTVQSTGQAKELVSSQQQDTSKFDLLEQPDATEREASRIEKVRLGMRQLALGIAHHNEAKTARETVQNKPETSVARQGIINAADWQGCLHWHADMEEQQEQSDRKNLSRKTKFELLQEQEEQYLKDANEAATNLRRYLLGITPGDGSRQPCDELRVLINTGAWMVNEFQSSHGKKSDKHREGDFPVY